jgi:hypothetical protein
MKKSFVFAALFALATIGLVFVGCNNGSSPAAVVPAGGGTPADYAATYTGSWAVGSSSGTSFTLDATAGTITGTHSGTGSDLSISSVTVGGGGTLSYGGSPVAGKWTYVYSGTTKIGIAYLVTSTMTSMTLGKITVNGIKSSLNSTYGISTIDTSDMSDDYAASGSHML